MRWALAVGRVRNVPVEVHYSWLLIFSFVVWLLASDFFPRFLPHSSVAGYWAASVITSGLVFVCLVAHEFGHVVVAQSRGLAVARVRLFLLGALVEVDLGESTSGEEFALAIAGPGVSLLLGGAFGSGWLLGGRAFGLLGAGFLYIALCNVMIGLFNLLPGLPLDGGRMVRAVLWRLLDDRARATRWAGILGVGLGAVTLFSGFVEVGRSSLDIGIWLGLVGIFLVGMAWHATIHP